MTDRIVYVLPVVPEAAANDSLEVVTPQTLQKIMAEGYRVVGQSDAPLRLGRKTHPSKMFILRRPEDERALAAPVAPEQHMVATHDQWGRPTGPVRQDEALARALSRVADAVDGSGEVSHLGRAVKVAIPGAHVVSGFMVGQAKDLGVTASMQGKPESANPFPSGTAPHSLWREGHREAANHTTRADLDVNAVKAAYDHGHREATMLGPDDEAYCPYPPMSPFHAHWLKGYIAGGGKVAPA